MSHGNLRALFSKRPCLAKPSLGTGINTMMDRFRKCQCREHPFTMDKMTRLVPPSEVIVKAETSGDRNISPSTSPPVG